MYAFVNQSTEPLPYSTTWQESGVFLTEKVEFWTGDLEVYTTTVYSATLIKNRGLTKPSTFHFPHNRDNLALMPDHLQAITHVLVFKLAKGSSILLSFILQGAVHA